MKKIFILLFVLNLITSCKINQKQNGLRHGKWVTKTENENENFKYIERYKNGEEVKTWKTFKNKKLYKKETHIKNICHISYYNENKKIESKGKSRYDKNSETAHWYYFGDWNFYNTDGRLTMTRKYENGVLQSEIKFE